MVHFIKAFLDDANNLSCDALVNPSNSRLRTVFSQLQCQIMRIHPHLRQIAAHEPQPLLGRWFPNVAELTLPRAVIRAQGL